MYSYNSIADIAVVLICISAAVLLKRENSKNEQNVPACIQLLVEYAVLGVLSIVYEMILYKGCVPKSILSICRFLYFTGYVACVYALADYINTTFITLSNKERNSLKVTHLFIACVFEFVYVVVEMISPEKAYESGFNVLRIYYQFAMGTLIFTTSLYEDKMASDTRTKILLTEMLSVFIFGIDMILLDDVTGILFSIAVPVFGTLLTVFANPCNIDNGAFDYKSAEVFLKKLINKQQKSSFEIVCLSVLQNNAIPKRNEEKFSQSIESAFYLLAQNGANGKLFQLKDNRFVYIFKNSKINRERTRNIIENKLCKILNENKIDYHLFILYSKKEFETPKQYLSFVKYCEKITPINCITCISYSSYVDFLNTEYILNQIKDINKKSDLNDERIQVFCQPVYNVEAKKYDTAEALMRLKTEKLGLLTPDKFIKLAEDNDCIHFLSLCILNKTCCEIKKLIDEGYAFSRITVNMCIKELTGPQVAEEIKDIITANQIPPSCVAIELTESCDDIQTHITQEVVDIIRGQKIKIYLDDFGTGYSNFDRIIKLPFDVVKFDKIFLTLNFDNEVKKLSVIKDTVNIFSNLGYEILFEGVETEKDESVCIEMGAKYLQGFLYSKPIPIYKVRDFFKRKTNY